MLGVIKVVGLLGSEAGVGIGCVGPLDVMVFIILVDFAGSFVVVLVGTSTVVLKTLVCVDGLNVVFIILMVDCGGVAVF